METKFVSDQQIADRYGVSRATVWRWAARGILPKPKSITPGTTRWRLDEVEEFDRRREVAA